MAYAVILLIILYAVLFVYKTKTGSPSIMSTSEHRTRLVKHVKPGMRVADLGCGDGQTLIAMVQAGAKDGEGWDIEPLVWLKAQRNVLKSKLEDRVTVHFGDMWRANLSSYDLVYVYQLDAYSARLSAKVRQEMRPGSLVISNTYELPDLTLEKRDGSLFVYRV